MSIIKNYNEGKTELNKLKFKGNMGSGHPGNPPLIQKRVPNESKEASSISGTGLSKRLDDIGRISQLFARREGLGFLANNTALNLTTAQASNQQTKDLSELKSNFVDAGTGLPNALKDTLLTLSSTLASIPVAGTGAHFVKGNLGKKLPKKTPATVSIGDPSRTKPKYDRDGFFYFNTSNPDAIDKVNYKYPYTGEESKFTTEPDYVKFLFEIMNPNENGYSTFLQFRAFIDNISDNYNANWNSYNYVGRGESFHTYNTFGREVAISFKSAIATREELEPVYRKLNLLASTTAPSYSANGIMRGTIVKMTVGNYIFDTPGYFSNVSYTWNTSYQWEIEGDQLPHALDCSISFTPIHTFVPQTLVEKFIATNETV